MQPSFAQGDSRTLQRLKTLRQEAQTDPAPRLALRLQALRLSVQGQTTGQIAQGLPVDRTRVHAWVGAWNEYSADGLLEGHRSGRPASLTDSQRDHLADILESGPGAYGLDPGVGTSPLLAQVLEEEVEVRSHPGHGRRWLGGMDFSVQRPKTRWVQADPKKQNRWIPDFNATERRWHDTRKARTHNRYFDCPEALCWSLFTTFTARQRHPAKIQGLLTPFS